MGGGVFNMFFFLSSASNNRIHRGNLGFCHLSTELPSEQPNLQCSPKKMESSVLGFFGFGPCFFSSVFGSRFLCPTILLVPYFQVPDPNLAVEQFTTPTAMAAEASSSSAFPEGDSLLRSLAARGWRFRDATDESIQALLHASPSPSPEALEADLLDADLRLFGGKALPDRAAATATKRLSYLHDPIVLQVVSVRDIYSSRVDASFKNPQQRRLLRFGLTDGISEVVAIEFSPIPFITEEIAPGTKIRLENKIPVNHGILCLGAKNVSVIGGTVQSLYEEWKMNQKFSGLSRPVLRLSQDDDGVGPPPFEKLDIEARPNRTFQLQAYPDHKARNLGVAHDHVSVNSSSKPTNEGSSHMNRENTASKAEPKQSTADIRPKEVSEAVPVQNQAAAQKLLQKMAMPEDRPGRGRFKGRSKQEDTPVFTLDEWERRKAVGSVSTTERHIQDTSRDEELARQLQEQLDLEDSHAMPAASEAERLRMNMFSFNGPEEMGGGRRDFRGRGRGRGRGRSRGRF